MANRIVLNETSYFGWGSREVICDEIKMKGLKKALLVTDDNLINTLFSVWEERTNDEEL